MASRDVFEDLARMNTVQARMLYAEGYREEAQQLAVTALAMRWLADTSHARAMLPARIRLSP